MYVLGLFYIFLVLNLEKGVGGLGYFEGEQKSRGGIEVVGGRLTRLNFCKMTGIANNSGPLIRQVSINTGSIVVFENKISLQKICQV